MIVYDKIVSHHLRLTLVLNSYMKLASFPQFMVLFVGIIHIFMFSLILLSRYSQICELMLISLQFQAKRREGLAAGVSLSETYALSE